MTYRLYDEEITLDDKLFESIIEDGYEYLKNEELPEYSDVITEDPLTGITLAVTDFLSNDSPLEGDDGEFLSWNEFLKLGHSFYKTDVLKGQKLGNIFEGMDLPITVYFPFAV